jgi:hypothetical protein
MNIKQTLYLFNDHDLIPLGHSSPDWFPMSTPPVRGARVTYGAVNVGHWVVIYVLHVACLLADSLTRPDIFREDVLLLLLAYVHAYVHVRTCVCVLYASPTYINAY